MLGEAQVAEPSCTLRSAKMSSAVSFAMSPVLDMTDDKFAIELRSAPAPKIAVQVSPTPAPAVHFSTAMRHPKRFKVPAMPPRPSMAASTRPLTDPVAGTTVLWVCMADQTLFGYQSDQGSLAQASNCGKVN